MDRIFDAVYGYIELEKVEFELVTSPIFQRLHGIKQLGPLHTIFSSASHSRFSHSLGVYHIVKKMVEHLRKNDEKGLQISDEEKKMLRYAALLHDIGHVPMSHVGERVLKETFKSSLNEREIDPFDNKAGWRELFDKDLSCGSARLHECLSAEIVLHNEGIDQILKEVSVWSNDEYREKVKKNIALMIVGKPENQLIRALLHSELDADRLDYLLRDSFFTGVRYGQVELDYIISRLKVVRDKDDEGILKLCIEKKGLHTVEHYILGRFFLKTQVIYNKKVRFMDLLFADVMEYLIKDRGNGKLAQTL